MNEEQKAKEYLKDLNEWQNKMYSPGEYLGGKLPPILKHGNRKFIKPYAWYTIIVIGLMFAVAIWQMVKYFLAGG